MIKSWRTKYTEICCVHPNKNFISKLSLCINKYLTVIQARIGQEGGGRGKKTHKRFWTQVLHSSGSKCLPRQRKLLILWNFLIPLISHWNIYVVKSNSLYWIFFFLCVRVIIRMLAYPTLYNFQSSLCYIKTYNYLYYYSLSTDTLFYVSTTFAVNLKFLSNLISTASIFKY